MLITNVSARPRITSNVPRWTSSALQAIAAPFPTPEHDAAAGGDPDVRADARPPT